MTYGLDTKALRYFVAVASHKSYTRASAFLRITQPAVTRQIQAIEREFGVRLFLRQGSQIDLTEAGLVLLEQAREILERVDAAGTLMKEAADEPGGLVTIGAPSATGAMLLPPVLLAYRRKYPKVFVRVVTAYTGDLAELLAHDRIDLALVFGQPTHADLEIHPLFEVELGLVAGMTTHLRRDPLKGRSDITLADAAALPLIAPSPTQTLRKVIDHACREIGVQPNVVMESDSLEVSKALVRAGLGYMFLGANGVQKEVEAGEMRYFRLSSTPVHWPLSLATRKTKAIGLATRMLIKEIEAGCQAV